MVRTPQNLTNTETEQRVTKEFIARFGEDEIYIASAPGRVNLIGEHTDYNQGYVLPMALDRRAYLAFRPRNDGIVHVHALDLDEEGQTDLSDIDVDALPRFMSFVIAPGDHMRRYKTPMRGYDAVLSSTIPIGGGVSSSSAVVVASASAFRHINQPDISLRHFVELLGECEWQYSGVRGGIMDQYTSLLAKRGMAMLLDCRSLESRYVRVPESLSVVVADTCTHHELVATPYNERRNACDQAAKVLDVSALRDADLQALETVRSELDPVHYRRARHVVSEIERTIACAEALERSDLKHIGQLVDQSHHSLRDDFQVSCDELNAMVEAAHSGPGCIGARMMGGGFGGCALVLAKPDDIEAMIEHLNHRYRAETGIEPRIFQTRAGAGACVEKGSIAP